MERELAYEYVCGWCPDCLSGDVPEDSAEPRCATCGYAFAMHLIIPYGGAPWKYSPELIADFQRYGGLRLMAPFGGRDPERISDFQHVRELYLSRYRGFHFSFIAGIQSLRSFELDFTTVTNLDGIEAASNLSVLELTECRTIGDISALAGAPRLGFVHIALCSQLRDLSPLGAVPCLRKLFVEGRGVASLKFLSNCSKLTDLSLAIDRIDDGDPSPLLGMASLQRLTVASKALPRGFGKILRSALPQCEIDVFTKV